MNASYPELARRRMPAAGLLVVLLAVGFGLAAPLQAGARQGTPQVGDPAAIASVEISGLVRSPGIFTVAELQTLPVETVESNFESGGTPETHTFTGVRLLDFLNLAEIDGDPEARNPLLTVYVVVTASDGYQIVLSGGELDPNFGDAPILLAWEQDGEPLAADRGPLRLVVPGDLRGGRHVWGVVSIDVRSIAEPAP